MTEHRIVIELSSQERDIAMKLAREAGYASVDEFVKFFLVDALTKSTSEERRLSDGVREGDKTQFVTGEIRRLHDELKSFLPESQKASKGVAASITLSGATQLSANDNATSANPASIPAAIFADGTSSANESGPTFTDSTSEQRPREIEIALDDELENMASAAFKDSPHLGFASSVKVSGGEPARQAKSSDPLEELLDQELLNKLPLSVKGQSPDVQVRTDLQPLPTVEGGLNDDTNAESVANLAVELMASSRQHSNDNPDTVVTETSSFATVDQPPKNTPPKRRRAKHEQNAEEVDGDTLSGQGAPPPQIKSPRISGNIPPPKRQT